MYPAPRRRPAGRRRREAPDGPGKAEASPAATGATGCNRVQPSADGCRRVQRRPPPPGTRQPPTPQQIKTLIQLVSNDKSRRLTFTRLHWYTDGASQVVAAVPAWSGCWGNVMASLGGQLPVCHMGGRPRVPCAGRVTSGPMSRTTGGMSRLVRSSDEPTHLQHYRLIYIGTGEQNGA